MTTFLREDQTTEIIFIFRLCFDLKDKESRFDNTFQGYYKAKGYLVHPDASAKHDFRAVDSFSLIGDVSGDQENLENWSRWNLKEKIQKWRGKVEGEQAVGAGFHESDVQLELLEIIILIKMMMFSTTR